MSLWRIAWRSIQQRGLASCLTSFSMALGVMLVVAVLTIHGVVSESFHNNSNLGYNMIVGAKGGKLQLTLNTVYYLSQPIENIPYRYYLEFLSADQRRQTGVEGAPSGDGEFAALTALAIPVCLGDYCGRFRVIGTTSDLFDKLRFGADNDRRFEFASGRNFQRDNPEHGYFEAVAGAVAARELGFQVGDQFSTTHGDPEGHSHDRKFTIVGVLKRSGTPNDRAVFVNMEGFYLMQGHAKPLGKEGEGEEGDGHAHEEADQPEASGTAKGSEADDHEHAAPMHHEHDDHGDSEHGAIPIDQREVTAILVRTVNPSVTPRLQNLINEGGRAQAVLPVRAITNLFEIFVRPVQETLLALTAMICIVSGLSILVSIYNSMSERRRDIAVMRALGAGRGTVMSVILLESTILAVGGGLVGWLLGHGLIGLAGPLVEERTGVAVGFLSFAPSVNLLELLGRRPTIEWMRVSTEALLIPALVLLAVVAGFLPAIAAYRTDVAQSLDA